MQQRSPPPPGSPTIEESHLEEPKISTPEIKEDFSLEESLMKKIRGRIESSPPLEILSGTSSKPTSILLSKEKWEAKSGISEELPSKPPLQPMEILPQVKKLDAPVVAAKAAERAPLLPLNPAEQSRYDTLIRFASVELEGMIKTQ